MTMPFDKIIANSIDSLNCFIYLLVMIDDFLYSYRNMLYQLDPGYHPPNRHTVSGLSEIMSKLIKQEQGFQI